MKTSVLCAISFLTVLPSLSGGTWNYDFITGGIDTNYWSTVNAYGTFTFTPSGSGVTVAGGNGSFQSGKLSLNLAQFPAITDFSISTTFTGGQLSGGVHQIQLEVNSASAGVLLDRSNQNLTEGSTGGNAINIYDGTVRALQQVSDPASGVSTPGTFTLTRSGSIYTYYWNSSQFWTGTYTADPLTSVYLALNDNNGATDATAVTWQSFSITSSAIPEPSTCAVLAGLAALGFAGWRRRNPRQVRTHVLL